MPAPRLRQAVRALSPREVAAGVVTFSPRDLGTQVATVLAEGVPHRPRDIAAL